MLIANPVVRNGGPDPAMFMSMERRGYKPSRRDTKPALGSADSRSCEALNGVRLINSSFKVKGEPIVETPRDRNDLIFVHRDRQSGAATTR